MIPTKNNLSRYLIVFNPVKSRRRKRILTRLLQTMKSRNLDWQLYPTEAGLVANQHYFDNHLHEFTDLIVLGGDGTFHQLINCLSTHPHIRVGLLPAGTGNDFARKWYQGIKVNQQIDIVLGDTFQSITLGACHFPADNLQTQKVRYFHNSLGTGFDSSIAKKLSGKKAIFRSLSYTMAALRYIPFFREPTLAMNFNGRELTYGNFVTVFANSHYFGGGLPIAPMACAEKTRLEVIWAEKRSLLSKMKLLLRVLLGRHLESNKVHHESLEASQFASIKTAGLDLQADGEYIGKSPCKIGVADFKLNLKSAT